MSKHTPGPWILEKTRYGFAVSNGSYGYIVETKDYEGRYGAIDSEANARLIAAAPELLAALKNLMTWKEGNESVPAWHNGNEPWNWAAAAIAKAEGGQDE